LERRDISFPHLQLRKRGGKKNPGERESYQSIFIRGRKKEEREK